MNALTEQDENAIADILKTQLHVEDAQLTDDARIMQDLCADSLDVVEIVMRVEEEFELTLTDEVTENVSTVGDLRRLLIEELAKQKGSNREA